MATVVWGNRPFWGRAAPSAIAAVGAGALIVLARLPLEGVLGAKSPFILTWPAIIVAAFLGGFWPALMVSALGLWVGQRALVLGGEEALRPGGAGVYLGFGLVFALAGGMRKRGLARQRADARQLSEMRDRLMQVARLNAMGEMAGALAHELNQPLTAIASYAGAAQRLVEQKPDETRPVVDLLEKVAGQAVRAREIIGRIRGQLSRDEPALTPQSLTEMVRESLAIAVAGRDRETPVRIEIDGKLDAVLADRVQLEQVMINLIRNALEAMAEAPRPELRISARPTAEGLIEVRFADTGPGLAPELAGRLFQPFVTGKPDGMGIGLAVSRGIVEAHGGTIRAETAPQGGALFCFTVRAAGSGG